MTVDTPIASGKRDWRAPCDLQATWYGSTCMRLSLEEHELVDAGNRSARGAGPIGDHRSSNLGDGPDLWEPFFFALWLNAAVLTMVVYYPSAGDLRGGFASVLPVAGWIMFLGIIAWVTEANRFALQELTVGLSIKERIVPGVIVLILFVSPVFSDSHHVLRDGFLWALPAVMIWAVSPTLVRLFLFWTLMGTWFNSFVIWGAGGLLLVLAFGATWLLALGATHFAFTGDPHGLTGWWPLRRLLRNVAVCAAPAVAMGVGTWWLWPRSLARRGVGADAMGPLGNPDQTGGGGVNTFDLLGLIYRTVFVVAMVLIVLVLMITIRRALRKRGALKIESDVLPGQVAKLQYAATEPAPPKPVLPGVRGRIVTLWGRWAQSMREDGLGRGAGETAREYAERLGRLEPDAEPPPAVTELVESAHYSPREPTSADVEAMQQFVRRELDRQKVRREKHEASRQT